MKGHLHHSQASDCVSQPQSRDGLRHGLRKLDADSLAGQRAIAGHPFCGSARGERKRHVEQLKVNNCSSKRRDSGLYRMSQTVCVCCDGR